MGISSNQTQEHSASANSATRLPTTLIVLTIESSLQITHPKLYYLGSVTLQYFMIYTTGREMLSVSRCPQNNSWHPLGIFCTQDAAIFSTSVVSRLPRCKLPQAAFKAHWSSSLPSGFLKISLFFCLTTLV